MLKFMSFSSGSCGNCYWLGDEEKALLIDAGVSPRSMKKTLAQNGLDITKAVGIILTHDHWDHVKFLASACKMLKLPVYTTDMVGRALSSRPYIASQFVACRKVLDEAQENDIGGFKVRCFTVPHDATQTVGYAIEIHGHKFVIMTDMGRMTDEAAQFAAQADTLVLESNYDVDMLMGGSYTYELKMRIMQGNGHLSNDECASALKRIWHPGLHNIFLCHLSENNNTPNMAYKASSQALAEINVDAGTVSLRCLPRTYPSALFNL